MNTILANLVKPRTPLKTSKIKKTIKTQKIFKIQKSWKNPLPTNHYAHHGQVSTGVSSEIILFSCTLSRRRSCFLFARRLVTADYHTEATDQ